MFFNSIQFTNFKLLRNTSLHLGPFTLLVGPNASGKSTALEGLRFLLHPDTSALSVGVEPPRRIAVAASITTPAGPIEIETSCEKHDHSPWCCNELAIIKPRERDLPEEREKLRQSLQNIRVFDFEPVQIAKPVTLEPDLTLQSDGSNLAGVLDQLRDSNPEQFESLNVELGRWLADFDRVLFTTPAPGQRAFQLRTRAGHYPISASALSDGTLLAIALLTLAYLPDPPPVVCVEDPDRGIHPRLLRQVRDVLYRLSHPQDFNQDRAPVQVIATTHAPYLLDLYKDHPEEIVISHFVDSNVRFERLSDRADILQILQDASLGEAWFSGILGGVPSNS